MTEDTITKLGKLIAEGEGRDAVHIAVAPVQAAVGVRLYSAQPIAFVSGSQEQVIPSQKGIGIVDPYLTEPVYAGQRFWMFLYPATITSLRHVWTHPAFDPEAQISKHDIRMRAGEWIQQFASSVGLGYYELMHVAQRYNEDPQYLLFGTEVSGSIPKEFWDNYEIVTGKKPANCPTGFRCAC